MDEFKCQKGVMKKCHDQEVCDGTYFGTDCDCAKANEAQMAPTERRMLAEYRKTGRTPEEISSLDHDVAMFKQSARMANEVWRTNAALRSERDNLQHQLDMYGGDEGITAVIQERDVLKKELKWIPVSERLPEESDGDESGEVLIYRDGEKWITKALWVKEEGATHWMSLPKPPKEAQHG